MNAVFEVFGLGDEPTWFEVEGSEGVELEADEAVVFETEEVVEFESDVFELDEFEADTFENIEAVEEFCKDVS